MFSKIFSFFKKQTKNFGSSKNVIMDAINIPEEEPKVTAKTTVCDFMIKGNINAKGDKIYHMPSGRFYERVQQPSDNFHSEEEAKTAGYRRSRM